MIEANLPSLLVIALIAGVGAYFGSYLREKGKNLATKEDVDRIVRKTEDIKAEVTGELWERQNRWTFKKELYIRLLDDLGEAASAVRQLRFLDERLKDPAHQHLVAETTRFMDEYFVKLKTAMGGIRHAAFIAPLVCTEATDQALGSLETGWLKAEATTGGTAYLEGCQSSLDEAIEAVTRAARADLRLTPRDSTTNGVLPTA